MEVPEELVAGGNPSSTSARSTNKQVVPSVGPKEPTMVEAAAELRAFEQVPPETPSVEHATPEERQVSEPGQGAPEQSGATPSTQEGDLSDAAARRKGLVVVSRPESSQRQEETKAGQQQEEPRTADAVESEDDDVLEEIEVHPNNRRQHVYVCRQRGDHFIYHEEIPIADETRKVELEAKRLIAEVQVSCFLCLHRPVS
jgi:hypothetical protein